MLGVVESSAYPQLKNESTAQLIKKLVYIWPLFRIHPTI